MQIDKTNILIHFSDVRANSRYIQTMHADLMQLNILFNCWQPSVSEPLVRVRAQAGSVLIAKTAATVCCSSSHTINMSVESISEFLFYYFAIFNGYFENA